MSIASPVDIMNSALRKLGAEPIITEDDNSTRARTVKASYYMRLDVLLRSHPWRFNKAYAELAVIDPKPADIFDYSFAFQLPTNCARVFETSIDTDAWEEIEGKILVCDQSAIKVKFGKYITDVTKFDANFVEVLACDIAADIAYTLTQSQSVKDGAVTALEKAMREARSYSAQSGSVKSIVYGDDWVAARR